MGMTTQKKNDANMNKRNRSKVRQLSRSFVPSLGMPLVRQRKPAVPPVLIPVPLRFLAPSLARGGRARKEPDLQSFESGSRPSAVG